MVIDIHTHTFPDKIAAGAIAKLQASSHTIPFTDGTNAHRLGSDYRHGTLRIQGGPGSHTLHLAPGGGFAIVLRPM